MPSGSYYRPGTDGAVIGLVAVTYDIVQAVPSRGLYVGAAGNATLVMEDGSTMTVVGLVAGMVYPFACVRVSSSGTTIAAASLAFAY